MVPYLMHVAILIAILYLSYHFLLSNVTFFKANRWILLVGIAIAFILPTIKVAPNLSFQPIQKSEQSRPLASNKSTHTERSSDPFQVESKSFVAPPEDLQSNTQHAIHPVHEKNAEKARLMPVYPAEFLKSIDFNKVITYIYLSGIALLLFHFLFQIVRLAAFAIRSDYRKDDGFHIFNSAQLPSSFSFFNFIFINKNKYDDQTYQQVLEHEKMHARSMHTIDMLIAEALLIVQWFNPFAWLYKKAIENNLEFLTDHSIISRGADKQHYQMSLVKEAVPAYALSFVSHYNQSFLKKRILMIHTSQSSIYSIWKYAFTIVLILCTVFLLNDTYAHDVNKVDLSSDIDLTSELSDIEADNRVSLQPNNQGQASMEAESLENDSGADLQDSSDEEELLDSEADLDFREDGFLVSEGSQIDGITGSWKINRWDESVCLSFSQKHNDGKWSWTNCDDNEEMIEMFNNQTLPFDFSRDAGTIRLEGSFNNGKGSGTFTFTPNARYASMLKSNGVSDVSDKSLFSCFAHDIGTDEMKEYVVGLKNMGYQNFEVSDIIKLRTHDVDIDYLNEMSKIGFEGLELEDYVRMAIHDVDPDYVAAMKTYGFEKMSSVEIIRMSVHDVDTEYLSDLKDAGMSGMDVEEIIRFAMHDVDADFIKSLSSAGLGSMSSEDIVRMSVHDVDEDFVKDLQAAGISDVNVEDLIRFSTHDVDADYIESLKTMGLTGLANEDIVRCSVHDVDEDFLRDIKLAGITNLDVDDLIRFSTHDVDADYVTALKSSGLKNLTNEEIIRGSIHDVDARFIKDLQSAGIDEFSMEDLIRFSTHDVDADFIASVRKMGLKNLSNDDYIKGTVHDLDAEYIQSILNLGFKDLTMEDFIGLNVHDIEADDIKRLQSKGHTGLSLEEYKRMIIQGH